MFEEQPEQAGSTIHTVRIGMAFIFLALAVPLGIWVLSLVNDSINDTKTPAIVQKIVPDQNTPAQITTPSGKFEFPKPFFNGFSYFILYLFLLIPTTITIALLKGSVSLLSPDLARQFRRLIDSFAKINTPKQ
jgi:hypothetical protein